MRRCMRCGGEIARGDGDFYHEGHEYGGRLDGRDFALDNWWQFRDTLVFR